MRLKSLNPTRYGRFTDNCQINFGEKPTSGHDFHIIYGPNEAGKSTLFNALKDLLFGIESRSSYNFLHEYGQMQIDAVIEVADKEHNLTRIKKPNNDLLDHAGAPVSEALFGTALIGMNRKNYSDMFSLDDDSLEEGGKSILSSEGELGRLLFSASSGLAGIHESLAYLREESAGIYDAGKRKTQLHEMKKQLEDMSAQIKQCDVNVSSFEKLSKAASDTKATYKHVQAEHNQQRERHQLLSRLLNTLSDWQALCALQQTHHFRGQTPPPVAWYEDINDLEKQDISLNTKKETATKAIAGLEQEMAGIDRDETILNIAKDVEFLAEQYTHYRQANKTDTLLTEQEQHQTKVAVCIQKLNTSKAPHQAQELLLSETMESHIRELLEKWQALSADLKAAKQEQEKASQHLSAAQKALQQCAKPQDTSWLKASMPEWQQQSAALKSQDKTLQQQLEDVKRALASDQAELTTIQGQTGTLDDQTAQDMRIKRDQAWEYHKTMLDQQTAGAFEDLLHEDDNLQQKRFDQHRDTLRLRELERNIAKQAATIKTLEQKISETQDSLLNLRSTLCEALLPLLEEENIPESITIETLLARLQQVIDAYAEQAELYRAATSKREAATVECDQRQNALTGCQAHLDDWQQNWQTALSSCWLDDAGYLPNEIRDVLETLSTLKQALRDQETTSRTLKENTDICEQFLKDAEVIAKLLGKPVNEDAIAVSLQAWKQRLRTAQDQQTILQGKQKDLGKAKSALRQIDENLEILSKTRETMEEVLQVSGFQALQQKLTAWKEYAAIKQRVLNALRCATLEETDTTFAEHLPNADAIAKAQVEFEKLSSKLEQLRKEENEAHTTWRQAEKDLAAVDTSDTVARLQEDKRSLLLEMQERATHYLYLKLGTYAVERALHQYRDAHQSRMLQKASEAFCTITKGAYGRLTMQPDSDNKEGLVAIAQDGRSKDVTAMSKGTAMQLYLALRMAGYQEFLQAREPLPFVADDILETFDDDRSAETFALLHELSKQGQIIYLTHHEHLCRKALDVCQGDVRIHNINGQNQLAAVA